MKKVMITMVALLLMVSCSKEDLTNRSEDTNALIITQTDNPTASKVMDPNAMDAEFKQLVQANQDRLDQLLERQACKKNVRVPQQYATIQEAVDNVCDGGTISVSTGTYTENVVISTDGVKIMARGNATLAGTFTIDADDVSIYNFNIDSGTGYGINAYGVNKGKITGNTITGTDATGIRYYDASNIDVVDNHVSGKSWGIFFGTGFITGESLNNKIVNNTVTGITTASVIGLQGNCDNNTIINNNLADNPSNANAAVMLYSGSPTVLDKCDNNVISKNTATDCIVGAWIFNGGEGNKIAQNNCSNNRNSGIYISGDVINNIIFSNTAVNNAVCDIINAADDLTANIFFSNTYDCMQP